MSQGIQILTFSFPERHFELALQGECLLAEFKTKSRQVAVANPLLWHLQHTKEHLAAHLLHIVL